MTIVMLGHKGIPARSGGIERVVEELSMSLVMRGHRVISFDRAWYVGDQEPVSGVIRRMSHGIKSKHLDAITHTMSAIVLARRERPDIIHMHGVGPALLAPLARFLHPKARVIVSFHCVDRAHAKWGKFAKLALRLGEIFACVFAHETISVSNVVAQYCLDTYECQTRIIPNGVRMRALKNSETLHALNLAPGSYLLMVTRLVAHKNPHIAIEAYRRLSETNPEFSKKYPLVIVGGSAETDDYVSELVLQSKIVPGVRLLGEKHGRELHELQAHALAHLSISSSEGMSLSLLEAMAAGRPVIVSDLPENTVVTGNDALIVKTNDIEDLMKLMSRLIVMSAEDREHMGARLQERAQKFHDWDVIALATEGVYADALGLIDMRLQNRFQEI